MRRPRRSSPSNVSVGQHHGKPRCSSREQRGKLSNTAPRGVNGYTNLTKRDASRQLTFGCSRSSWRQRRMSTKSPSQKPRTSSKVPFVLTLYCIKHFGPRGPRQRSVFDCSSEQKQRLYKIIRISPSPLMCHHGTGHPGVTRICFQRNIRAAAQRKSMSLILQLSQTSLAKTSVAP